MRPGLGLSPSPDAPISHFNTNLNIIKHIWFIRNTVWASGSPHSTKARNHRGGPGFDPHGLHKILNNKPLPITGCHVAAHDWATWHQPFVKMMPRVTSSFDHICQSKTATSSHATSAYIMVSATSSYGPCHVSLYGLHSQRPFFLPV
jgi:hypothetical protein